MKDSRDARNVCQSVELRLFTGFAISAQPLWRHVPDQLGAAVQWIHIEPATKYSNERRHITATDAKAIVKPSAAGPRLRILRHSPANCHLQPRPITSSPVGSPERSQPRFDQPQAWTEERYAVLSHLHRMATSAHEPVLEPFSEASRLEVWKALHQSVILNASPLTALRVGSVSGVDI